MLLLLFYLVHTHTPVIEAFISVLVLDTTRQLWALPLSDGQVERNQDSGTLNSHVLFIVRQQPLENILESNDHCPATAKLKQYGYSGVKQPR